MAIDKFSINGAANGAVNKLGFKPVDHKEFEKKGMALYRAPSLLQPHRVRFLLKVTFSLQIFKTSETT